MKNKKKNSIKGTKLSNSTHWNDWNNAMSNSGKTKNKKHDSKKFACRGKISY